MAIKTSTGLAAHLMVSGAARAAFEGGFIRVYSGAVPETADAPVTGDLLWEISTGGDGTGLSFETAAVGRAMVKKASDTWQGPTSAGTATYWRLVGAADDGLESATQPRIQGTCGNTAGADLYMSNTTLSANAALDAKVLAAFSVALPTN